MNRLQFYIPKRVLPEERTKGVLNENVSISISQRLLLFLFVCLYLKHGGGFEDFQTVYGNAC